jgi:hypothetical protein
MLNQQRVGCKLRTTMQISATERPIRARPTTNQITALDLMRYMDSIAWRDAQIGTWLAKDFSHLPSKVPPAAPADDAASLE